MASDVPYGNLPNTKFVQVFTCIFSYCESKSHILQSNLYLLNPFMYILIKLVSQRSNVITILVDHNLTH